MIISRRKVKGNIFYLQFFRVSQAKGHFQLSLGMSGYRYAVRNQHELVPFATR